MPNQVEQALSLLDPEFLRRLERLALVVHRVRLGINKGERDSKRKGISIEFADYRNYVQGDDLRFVDWNIYGRLDDLYLKLFREQEDLTLHLLIDASPSMSFGNPRKIEFAGKLSAALGYIALVGYDRVSVEAFCETVRPMRPCRGRASAGKLFGYIDSIVTSGGTNLERAVHSYILRNRAKGVTVLISDFFDPEGYEGSIRRLIQSGSDLYVVHVMAPEEIDPELSGDLKLVDCETQGTAEISVSRALLKRYGNNRDAFCQGLRDFCRARGIGCFFASSATDVERLTLDVLRRGGMLK